MKLSATSALPFAALVLGALAVPACGREYVRGSQDPSIDNAAMSTGIDKDDIQRTLHHVLNKLRVASVMDKWRKHTDPRDTVAIAPFQNETSEHIDSQLGAILNETETWLVRAQVVSVIDQSRQLDMIRKVEGSQHPVFNRNRVPEYGKQLGVKYYVTGKVSAVDERTESARRVQYMLYLQVIDVETGGVEWQENDEITKMAR